MTTQAIDATPQRIDNVASDASAKSNPFADFLKTRQEDFQNKGNTAQQLTHELDKGLAGGSSAFKALPEIKPPENTVANDRKFDVAAAMQTTGKNQVANEAADKALKHVA